MPTALTPRRLAALLAASVACAPLAGCGREGVGTAPAPPTGPPRWSAVREERQPGGGVIDIKADAPCRVVLSVVGVESQPTQDADRLLAAGELARLWWRADAVKVAHAGTTTVSVEDATAGRTEGWMAALHYGWQDGGAARKSTIVGTRPGRGAVRGPRNALPPLAPAPLAFDAEVELAAIAVVDGGAPELELVAGERGARLTGPLDAAAGDRARILRLLLRIVPVQ
jgi:hypothetical protein